VLVKLTIKLKVVLSDLTYSIGVATKEAARRLIGIPKSPQGSETTADVLDENDFQELFRFVDKDVHEGLIGTQEAARLRYCGDQTKFWVGILTAVRYILLSLRYPKPQSPMRGHEVCAVVYETGIRGYTTLLFQDRDLAYSATSDVDALDVASVAFGLLDKTAYLIQQDAFLNSTTRENLASRQDHRRTRIAWRYQVTSPQADGTKQGPSSKEGSFSLESFWSRKCLDLDGIEQLTPMMVALAMVSPAFTTSFAQFLKMMTATRDVEDTIDFVEGSDFSAYFCLTLGTGALRDRDTGADVLPLSQAVSRGYLQRGSLLGWGHNSSSIAERLNQLIHTMDMWITDGALVTVRFGWYVWSVISVAASLAARGLAIGFSVGDRIPGVNPFNLATYTWVVAAFIVLICKNVWVDAWTWSDFLHRRVRCRSVSSLRDTTGIGDQLILAKLLEDERGAGALRTQGPYNSLFLNRASDDITGLSIDCPIRASTLLVSGLTLVKVASPMGDLFVCLDSRRGMGLKIVDNQPLDKQQHIVCEDISWLVEPGRRRRHRPVSPTDRSLEAPSWTWDDGSLVMLRRKEVKNLRWTRVLGIYDARNVVFV